MRLGNLVLLMALVFDYVEASTDSLTFWFHSVSGSYRFEMPSFKDQEIRQFDFLNDSFKEQFQSLKDLTPKRVTSFLTQYPENRDALVRYLIDLPEYLLIDIHRIQLLRTIERFRADTASPQKSQPIRLTTLNLEVHPHVRSHTLTSVKSAQKKHQHAAPTGLLSSPTHQEESGLEFRFYRGLLLEYHFNTPALLRFDVHRQRFELHWNFD